MAVEGVINLFKPVGPSSAFYAYKLRPMLGERRVGHAGALDPFADGVLLACVGKATKLVEQLMGLPKTYETTLQLGVTNPSFDPETPFEPVPGAADPGRAAVERAVAAMTGCIEQIPPSFSAVKVDGRPAYKQARAAARAKAQAGTGAAGDAISPEPVAPPPRSVRIDRLEIRRYAWPELDLTIACGRGTYIRAIARDIGQALGCGAVCRTLRRTGVGLFRSEDGIDLWRASREALRAALRPAADIAAMLSGPT